MTESPPSGFGEPFFAWIGRVSDALSVTFVSKGNLPMADVRRFEQKLGFVLPEDIRRFYTRFSPWAPLRDWNHWDETVLRIQEATGLVTPLAPIDHRSYSPNGWDVVAAVSSSDHYEVITYTRRERQIRKYQSLRSYFIGQVLDEINGTDGESPWPGAERDM